MKTQLDMKWVDFQQIIKQGSPMILFGASSGAETFLNKLHGDNATICFLIDNDPNKQGRNFCGHKICSIDELEKYNSENQIVLITSSYYDEILQQLADFGFRGRVYSLLHMSNRVVECTGYDTAYLTEVISKLKGLCNDDRSRALIDIIMRKRRENISDYSDICEENQYFIKEFMQLKENEIFIDGGSYDGETIDEFIDFSNGNFYKIYAFEMDKKNFSTISQERYDERVCFFNYGLWDCMQTLSYVENGTSSWVMENASMTAECISLDRFMADKERPVTFIKMDIEGAELNALEGAKTLICEDKPKLAICLYHKFEHLWEIPFFIHSLVPEYKFSIRHHSNNANETVLYAYME